MAEGPDGRINLTWGGPDSYVMDARLARHTSDDTNLVKKARVQDN